MFSPLTPKPSIGDNVQDEEKPDLIIGVDFGQTCSGVAYAFPSHGDSIRCIQRWPGRSQANENKVPTVLVYPYGQDRPSSWGFGCEKPAQQNPNYGNCRDWFKTLLDPVNLEIQRTRDPETNFTHEDVRHWYRDFFTKLYEHIQQTLSAELPNFEWTRANVEFLFSVPTTWNHQIVESFREIILQSGYGGSPNARHNVVMSLTEAEAAAVHTSTTSGSDFRQGDILIVCDAGGGTTDMSALEITETMTEALSLKQLRQVDVVGGDNIGSVGIDFEFQMLVEDRLKRAESERTLGVDPADAAWAMAKGRDFQDVKCYHGAPYEAPSFSVPVPNLRLEHQSDSAKIRQGEMLFEKQELRRLFDHQVDRLFKIIDKQLMALSNKVPEKQVSHLILSGGLGQSPYVQQRLVEHYRDNFGLALNIQDMQVRLAPEPQLAVCKGLVADRLRKLKAGQSVLGWRCCRASYGLLCKELYNAKNEKHHNQKTSVDTRDGKTYVDNCISWFVERASPVSIDKPIIHDFKRKVAPGDPRKIFPTSVVVSYLEKDLLPYTMDETVEKLCEVEADLSVADEKRFKEKNKRFWQPGEHHLVVDFQVKVVIGPADLRFELWFDNQKMSKENSIKVEWASASAPSTAALQPPRMSPDNVKTAREVKKGRTRFNLNRLRSGERPPTPPEGREPGEANGDNRT